MPFNPHLPFTTAAARAAGITKAQLAGPAYRQLLRSVWISAAVPHQRSQRTAAALLIHQAGAVARHSSTAALLGAPVPVDPLGHITVSRAQDRRHRHGLRCHVAALREQEIRVVQGMRISEPRRLFVELASMLALVDLVVVGDWLVQQRHATCASLVAYCAATSDRHAEDARRAAAYVRGRVDSPMETLAADASGVGRVAGAGGEPEASRRIRGGDDAAGPQLSAGSPGGGVRRVPARRARTAVGAGRGTARGARRVEVAAPRGHEQGDLPGARTHRAAGLERPARAGVPAACVWFGEGGWAAAGTLGP